MSYIILFVSFYLAVTGFLLCLLHAPVLTMLVATPFFLREILRDC